MFFFVQNVVGSYVAPINIFVTIAVTLLLFLFSDCCQ